MNHTQNEISQRLSRYQFQRMADLCKLKISPEATAEYVLQRDRSRLSDAEVFVAAISNVEFTLEDLMCVWHTFPFIFSKELISIDSEQVCRLS